MESLQSQTIIKDKYSITFELRGLPTRANVILSSHWRVRQYNAKKWRGLVVRTLEHANKPSPPLVKYKLFLTRFGHRFLDYDSLVLCFKPVVDGLIDAGIIENDSWKNSGPWTVTQEKIAKDLEKIMITIYEE